MSVLFAQADVAASTTPIPLALAAILAGAYCVRHKGAQWYVIAIGIVIGVLGANMFIGEFTRSGVQFLTDIVNDVWNGLSKLKAPQ